jgi:predicted RNA-binding protein (virulence factor B family)
MLALGHWMELEAVRRFDFGVIFSDPEGSGEALLPASKVPENLKLGDRLELFVHLDSQQRPVLTTEEPPMVLDEVGLLQVKAVREQGAFMAWLSDRDLFLPFAEAPEVLRVGHKLWIQLQFDEKSGRLVGSTRLDRFYPSVSQAFEYNQEVELKVFRRTPLGWLALAEDRAIGLILAQNVPVGLDTTKTHKGYVTELREDGKLGFSFRPGGFRAAIEGDRERVLRLLDENQGELKLTDHSSPELIQRIAGMSKKAYKKTIGGLWRDGVIDLEEESIRLVNPAKKR